MFIEIVLALVFWIPGGSGDFTRVDRFGNRITGGKEGLVLYGRKGMGTRYDYTYGKICDDTFNDDAASVICREMGYLTFNTWSTGDKWPIQSRYSNYMGNMNCRGPESLSHCSTNTGRTDCYGYHDVFLSCRPCPPGTERERKKDDSNTCVQCPADTYKSPEGIEEYCTDCPGSSTSKPGSSYCTCPPNYISSTEDMVCICPEGQSWVWDGLGIGHCSCRAGMFWNETSCQVCPEGSVSQEGSSQCQECPLNSIPGSDNMICICPEGQSWVWDGLGVGSCKDSQNGISPFAWFSVVLIIVIVILAFLICLLVYERIKRRRKEESSPSKDRGSVYAANGEGETSEVKTQED